MRKVLIAAFVLTSPCTACMSDSSNPEEWRAGDLRDLPDYFVALRNARSADAFLVLEVQQTGDFLQFTASSSLIELDMPLITQRQRDLEPMFRAAAHGLGLVVRVTAGSDGSQFLDIDLHGSTLDAADVASEFIVRLFDIKRDAAIRVLCHACS
jgi:hypothetical protein